MKHKQLGVTLLEVLLVLAIIAALTVVSIRQYLSYQAQASVQIVQYNVNSLLLAMANYYHANCGPIPINTNTDDYGALYPGDGSNPESSQAIKLKDLIKKNFLLVPLQSTPITHGTGSDDYILQFNPYVTKDSRLLCTKQDKNGVCQETAPIGTVVNWTIQVSVKLADSITQSPGAATTYMNVLGADCLSDSKGKIVKPCGSGKKKSKTGKFAVWERTPSSVDVTMSPDTYISSSQISLFTQMYTNASSTFLAGSGGIAPGNKKQTEWFTCGN